MSCGRENKLGGPNCYCKKCVPPKPRKYVDLYDGKSKTFAQILSDFLNRMSRSRKRRKSKDRRKWRCVCGSLYCRYYDDNLNDKHEMQQKYRETKNALRQPAQSEMEASMRDGDEQFELRRNQVREDKT